MFAPATRLKPCSKLSLVISLEAVLSGIVVKDVADDHEQLLELTCHCLSASMVIGMSFEL